MRSKLLFLKVLILAMTALSVTVQANFYTDPGFEEGSGGLPDAWSAWSGYGAGTYEYHIDDGQAKTGQDCMEVGSPAGSDPCDFQWLFEDIPDMSENTSYTAGAYFKDILVGGSTAKVQIAFEWWITRDEDKISYETMEFTIPDDDAWHWVSWTRTSPPGTLLIAPMIGTDGEGESAYLIDDAVFRVSGAGSPEPGNNSKVQAPGTVDLKWENSTADTCTVYWDSGNNDVNDINFQYHVDNNLGTKVYLLDTVTNEEPNEVLSNAVVGGKNYFWRVDVGSQVGAVWKFSTINDAPDVDAGPKQALWQDASANPVTFQLAPTVSDDGLPIPPGTLKYEWTKTSGPGTVTFSPGGATSSDPAPTVTMSDPCAVGDYELTLTVSDGVTIPAVAPAKDNSDTVLLRVHDNATTGLEVRYHCEEGNPAAGIHDPYTGYPMNSPDPASRRGERMNDIDTTGITGTTMDATGGHNTSVLDPNPPDKGGIIFDGVAGHVEAYNSSNDPNIDPEDPAWADFRDEVSLAAWIKVDTENGGWDDTWETIIAKGEGSYRLQRNTNGSSIQMAVNIDGSTSIAAGTTAVNDGEWHHVMGTYDGAEVCVYVDGLEETCVDAEGQIDWVTGNEGDNPALTIGQSKENDSPFGGMMDEIRVHSIGLPHRSDNPEAAPVTEINARSVVSIYRTSDGHANCGGAFMDGDADGDCYVNLDDVKVIAALWLECNSIARPSCDAYWK